MWHCRHGMMEDLWMNVLMMLMVRLKVMVGRRWRRRWMWMSMSLSRVSRRRELQYPYVVRAVRCLGVGRVLLVAVTGMRRTVVLYEGALS